MDASRTTIVFGPPGCGKTTTLLNKVASYLNSDIKPEDIGFVSFTKQACEEAKGRASERFTLKRKQLVNFRTLHSMAFQMLGLNSNSVIKYKHYQEVAHACGVSVTHRAARMNSEEGLWIGATHGDKILFLENLARISGITLSDALDQSEFEDITRIELELWQRTLRSYKNANALFDFTDMVVDWLERGAVPKLKVLFVDEAQDLSKIQWEMVYKLANQDCDIWIAGDDDQAIFKWSGAAPELFVQCAGNRVVLHQSYRVPKIVHSLAMELRAQITDSVEKEYKPTLEQGFLDFYGELEQINMDSGNWLILCRNNYLVSSVEESCRKLGLWYNSLFDPPTRCTVPIINYHKFLHGSRLSISELEEVLKMIGKEFILQHDYNLNEFCEEFGHDHYHLVSSLQEKRPWFDVFQNMSVDKRAYYRSVLAKGTDIRGMPRLRISTIHGAKGGEEDNVVLITDISEKTYAKATLCWADEYRVWYVAVTRAKHTLHIVRPKTNKCLPLLAL